MLDRLLEELDARSLRLLMLGVILLVTVVTVTYGILPQYKQWRSQSESVSVLRGVQEEQSDVETQMQILRDELQSLRKNMRGDLPEMPMQQLEAYIMGRFQMVSWESNMRLRGVRPGINQSIRRFEEISFDVELAGDYFNLFEWLWLLGRELGFVVVKNFEITPASYSESTPELTTRLNIVFYQPVTQ